MDAPEKDAIEAAAKAKQEQLKEKETRKRAKKERSRLKKGRNQQKTQEVFETYSGRK